MWKFSDGGLREVPAYSFDKAESFVSLRSDVFNMPCP